MANTYTRLYVHAVIRVKRGYPRIKTAFEKELHAYIGGIIKNRGHIPVTINGVSDHVHILFIQRPIESLSGIMREVKSESSRLINEQKWVRRKFRWQVGYGAFSINHHNVDKVVGYIKRQNEHHAKGPTFREEYEKFLDDYGIDWDVRYVED